MITLIDIINTLIDIINTLINIIINTLINTIINAFINIIINTVINTTIYNFFIFKAVYSNLNVIELSSDLGASLSDIVQSLLSLLQIFALRYVDNASDIHSRTTHHIIRAVSYMDRLARNIRM